jgi:hypothetical protein
VPAGDQAVRQCQPADARSHDEHVHAATPFTTIVVLRILA